MTASKHSSFISYSNINIKNRWENDDGWKTIISQRITYQMFITPIEKKIQATTVAKKQKQK
jgi:hypothetical protein